MYEVMNEWIVSGWQVGGCAIEDVGWWIQG